MPSNTPFVVRNIAFFVMLGFAVLEVLFIVGEYWTDPGGVEAIVGSIGVVATIVGVSIWAWFSPRTAQYYLWASVGGDRGGGPVVGGGSTLRDGCDGRAGADHPGRGDHRGSAAGVLGPT
jgi:hypothetical protein